MAQSTDGSVSEGLPTATFAQNYLIAASEYGVKLAIPNISAVTAGSEVEGTVLFGTSSGEEFGEDESYDGTFQASDAYGNQYEAYVDEEGNILSVDGTVIEGAYFDENGDVVDGMGNVISLSDQSENSAESGATYAQITDVDGSMIEINNTELYPDSAAFTIHCLQSGTTSFTIDFYDANGIQIYSAEYNLSIL